MQQPRSLMDFMRQFLTPQIWKQARQAVSPRRRQPRWDLQPLVLLLLAMTWVAGDSEQERFEAQRGFYVMSYESRKRPGQNELLGLGIQLPALNTRLPGTITRCIGTSTRRIGTSTRILRLNI